jgi:N-carbamoyl-L-amino-acid hydrolase
MAGLEVLRSAAAAGTPPCTIKLVDWADEEGARFGRSLLGSSAFAGTLEIADVREFTDKDGIRLDDALKAMGVDLDQSHLAKRRIDDVKAYLELHIEQGPVLESEGLAVGAVLGTVGVERYTVTFRGQAAHAGSTPMLQRRDTFSAAARFALLLRDVAISHEGVSTIGNANCTPGVVTAVPGVTEILVDQRHLDADTLAAMNADARAASEAAAAEFGCTVAWEQLWRIPPIPFDPALIEDARAAVREVTGTDRALPSGPLHDAAEMARMVPTVMLFASSTNGLSHCPEEDTPEEHLLLAAEAFGIAAGRAIDRVGSL